MLDLFIACHEVARLFKEMCSEDKFAPNLLIKFDKWSYGLHHYYEDMEGDVQWISTMPASAQLLLTLWEDTLIRHDYDPLLKQCKVSSSTLQDGFWQKQPFQGAYQACVEELRKEEAGKPSAEAPTTLSLKNLSPAPVEKNAFSCSSSDPAGSSDPAQLKLQKWAKYAKLYMIVGSSWSQIQETQTPFVKSSSPRH